MAQFVDFGCRLTAPPPVVCNNSVLYALQVDADPFKLQALCARVFDLPSNLTVTCTAVGNHVLLLFGKLDWVGTDKGITGVDAGVTELQLLFHVPVDVFENGVLKTTAYFTPFAWVNNPLSMAGGREVFGYPKSVGKITLAGTPDKPSLTVHTWCGDIKNNYWRERDLILIRPSRTASKSLTTLTKKSQQAFDAWLNGYTTEILFKQFRAIDSNYRNNNASFQQIATVTYNASTPNRYPLPGSFDLTINEFDSAPLFDELGVTSATGLTATRVQMDSFTIGDPQVLWQMP